MRDLGEKCCELLAIAGDVWFVRHVYSEIFAEQCE